MDTPKSMRIVYSFNWKGLARAKRYFAKADAPKKVEVFASGNVGSKRISFILDCINISITAAAPPKLETGRFKGITYVSMLQVTYPRTNFSNDVDRRRTD